MDLHGLLPNAFLFAALTGGALFLLQMLISAVGAGEADAGVDAGGDVHLAHPDAHFAGVFSFRSVTAAVAVFGLSGQAVRSLGGPDGLALVVAAGVGVATLFVVALVVRMMLKLADSGTFRVEQAVGSRGVVYVGIPPQGGGVGKVHLSVQGRTVEIEAAASGAALVTGTPVIVTAVIGPGCVEVVRNY